MEKKKLCQGNFHSLTSFYHRLVKSHPQLAGVELLPYHTFGISKALDAGRAPVRFPVPTEEMIQGWLAYFHQNGCPGVSLG